MADYQRSVDEIRAFLQSGDLTTLEQMKEPAAAYAEACRDVNQRLRRCSDFLQRRLYSEAIQTAQAEQGKRI